MIIEEKIRGILYRLFPFIERHDNVRKFIKFCIVGSTNVLIDFLVYLFATRILHLYLVLANIVSFTVSVSWSFIFNKHWTFQDRLTEKMKEQYSKFFFISTIGVAVQTFALYVFVEKYGMNDIVIKAITTFVIAFWNFFMSRFWVFKIR